MHSGIVRADISVGGIQRAVQYPDVRMIDGCLYASLDKFRLGGENNIAALADGVLYGFFHQLGSQILIAESGNLIGKSLFQMEPAQFMGISPG